MQGGGGAAAAPATKIPKYVLSLEGQEPCTFGEVLERDFKCSKPAPAPFQPPGEVKEAFFDYEEFADLQRLGGSRESDGIFLRLHRHGSLNAPHTHTQQLKLFKLFDAFAGVMVKDLARAEEMWEVRKNKKVAIQKTLEEANAAL